MTTATAIRPVTVPGKGELLVEPTADPTVVLVHSQSTKTPGQKYRIEYDFDGRPTCQCHDFTYSGKGDCKHTRAAYLFLGEQPMTTETEWATTETPTSTNPTAALYAALAKAQAEAGNAVKRATGQIGQNRGYRYADLRAVDEAIGEALTNNGLAIVQFPGLYREGCQHLKNVIVHKDGGSMEWEMSIPCKNDAQGAGSGLTYARRYALIGIMRVVTEDDDGRGAMSNGNGHPSQHNNNAPRPAQRATEAFSVADQMIEAAKNSATPGLATPGTVRALATVSKMPVGMLGAYFADSPTYKPLNDGDIAGWLEANSGASPEELLTTVAAWGVSTLANGNLKAEAQNWLDRQKVPA